jgi:hypothetical protein
VPTIVYTHTNNLLLAELSATTSFYGPLSSSPASERARYCVTFPIPACILPHLRCLISSLFIVVGFPQNRAPHPEPPGVIIASAKVCRYIPHRGSLAKDTRTLLMTKQQYELAVCRGTADLVDRLNATECDDVRVTAHAIG